MKRSAPSVSLAAPIHWSAGPLSGFATCRSVAPLDSVRTSTVYRHSEDFRTRASVHVPGQGGSQAGRELEKVLAVKATAQGACQFFGVPEDSGRVRRS